MTLIVVIAAVAFVVVICLALIVSRSRQREEWEHFRQVADMTSAWSRESGTPYRTGDGVPADGSADPRADLPADLPADASPAPDGAERSIDLRDRPARTTESVERG